MLKGECLIHSRGEVHWASWLRVQSLPQYKDAEASVIESWRKMVANVLYIPRSQQNQADAVNCALILLGCLRAPNKQAAAQVIRQRANAIRALAMNGNTEFFRHLGRILSETRRINLSRYEYPHAMLSQWLTGYLWLMAEKCAAEWLGRWLGVREVSNASTVRRFRKAKHDGYSLKSHSPSLVNHIEDDGKIVLTKEGRRLLAPSVQPRQQSVPSRGTA